LGVCPFLTICKKQVNYAYYTEYCTNLKEDKCKQCDEYKKLAAQTQTPLEWSRAAAPPAT